MNHKQKLERIKSRAQRISYLDIMDEFHYNNLTVMYIRYIKCTCEVEDMIDEMMEEVDSMYVYKKKEYRYPWQTYKRTMVKLVVIN